MKESEMQKSDRNQREGEQVVSGRHRPGYDGTVHSHMVGKNQWVE
jgi:hypothetical protein